MIGLCDESIVVYTAIALGGHMAGADLGKLCEPSYLTIIVPKSSVLG